MFQIQHAYSQVHARVPEIALAFQTSHLHSKVHRPAITRGPQPPDQAHDPGAEACFLMCALDCSVERTLH
eukprot:365556-Chlamydomonas_euryale.AAC.5